MAASSRFSERYGPWALVTGASDGIGRAMATALAARGLNVVLTARRLTALEALAAELRAAHGVEARVLAVDLAEPDGPRRVIEAVRDLDLGLYVGSAGFGTSGDFLDNDLETELAMIDVNCRALVALAHGVGARLAGRGRGGMILLSSLVAFQGVPRAANYAATKAFVQSLAEGLRLELGARGVDVLASAPGPVESGFAARADMRMGAAVAPAQVAEVSLRALGRATTVRPGWLSLLLESSLALLPRGMRSRILGLVMRGMTKHQLELGAGRPA